MEFFPLSSTNLESGVFRLAINNNGPFPLNIYPCPQIAGEVSISVQGHQLRGGRVSRANLTLVPLDPFENICGLYDIRGLATMASGGLRVDSFNDCSPRRHGGTEREVESNYVQDSLRASRGRTVKWGM